MEWARTWASPSHTPPCLGLQTTCPVGTLHIPILQMKTPGQKNYVAHPWSQS